jgi:hypothetical protein
MILSAIPGRDIPYWSTTRSTGNVTAMTNDNQEAEAEGDKHDHSKDYGCRDHCTASMWISFTA